MNLKPQEKKAIEQQISDLKAMNQKLNEQLKKAANARRPVTKPNKRLAPNS